MAVGWIRTRLRKGGRETPTVSVRRSLLAGVTGDVIELLAGDAKSLPFYPYANMTSLTLIDKKLSKAVHTYEFGEMPVTLLSRSPDVLPFEKCSFDCACLFFAISEMAEPYQALAELRRVLRPCGRLIFLDHVRPDGVWSLLWGGANLVRRITSRGNSNHSRNIPSMLEISGFRVTHLNRLGPTLLCGAAEKV